MIRIIHVVFNIFYYYYHCNDYAQLYIYICVHSHNMSLNHSCELWGLFFSRFSNQVVVQVVALFSKCRFRRFLLVCLDLRIDVLSKCRALLKTPVASEASPRKNVVVTGGCPNIWQRMNNMPTGGFHDYGYPWLPQSSSKSEPDGISPSAGPCWTSAGLKLPAALGSGSCSGRAPGHRRLCPPLGPSPGGVLVDSDRNKAFHSHGRLPQ